MDLVSDLEWLYRQDLTKIGQGSFPFFGVRLTQFFSLDKGCLRLHIM